MMNWQVDDEVSGEKRFLLSDQIVGHGSATASVLWVDLKNKIIVTQSRRKGKRNFGKYFRNMIEVIENHLLAP